VPHDFAEVRLAAEKLVTDPEQVVLALARERNARPDQRSAVVCRDVALNRPDNAVEQIEPPVHVADDIKPRVIVHRRHWRLLSIEKGRLCSAGQRGSLQRPFTAPGQWPPERTAETPTRGHRRRRF